MIETERLILRGWREADFEAFAALNADPQVMAHFPATLDRAQSDAFAQANQRHIIENGLGFWAVERKDDQAFMGFTGLRRLPPQNPLSPGVEVGWRLARHAWGQGYASEAATASLRYGFDQAGLTEIVSFTATENLRSQAVMRRIGMTRAPDLDFEHPALPPGHRLRPHVVYVMAAPL